MRFRIGGVEFGNSPHLGRGPILVRGFSPAGAEVRSMDSARLGRDGVMPGRDYLGGATWVFELRTNEKYASHARETYSALQRIWHDPAHRGATGELVALDYEAKGTAEWRRVYGRPRRFDPPNGNYLMVQGRADFGMEFEVLDPRFFSGSEQGLYEQTLTHAGEVQGGWYFPAVFPLRSEEVVGNRQGALTNDGDVHTPLTVTFTGPIVNPLLRGSYGWEVGYQGSLRFDERVVIDPMNGTVMHYDGNGRGTARFGNLTRRTQLSRIGLDPGMENVFFSGADDTHSSTAIVQWRHAYQSF